MRILVGVAAKCGENPHRRRGQGSSAMFVSRGLVGPKAFPNRGRSKGKQVNIPAPCGSLPDIGRIAVGGVVVPGDSTAEASGEPSWREGGEGGSRGESPSAHPWCP